MTHQPHRRPHVGLAIGAALLLAVAAAPVIAQNPPQRQGQQQGARRPGPQMEIDTARARQLYVSTRPEDHPPSNYEAAIQRKARTDSIYRAVAASGEFDFKKIGYRSRIGDLDIPAYLFEPKQRRGARGHAALIMVHGGVHGDWTPSYLPYVREAIRRGYVVIAPEYRGSTGYGQAFHEEIDYGGYEVDDVITAYDYMVKSLPHVDPERVGMMGWSHGGFITAHSLFRDSTVFKAGAAIVPVTNLIHRLSWGGPGYQRSFATQKRIQGLPFEKREIYKERSPLYHVDKLEVPILVHVATNDDDVWFAEAEQMINALRAKKPHLAETRVYVDPPGRHTFSRLVDDNYQPTWTKEMKDSWDRTWTFLEWNLDPSVDKSKPLPPDPARR